MITAYAQGVRTRFAGIIVSLLAVSFAAQPAIAATTHQEYVDEVNPICKDANGDVKRIPKKIKPSDDPGAEAYREARLFSKIIGRTARKIERVDPIPEDKAAVDDYTDTLRELKRVIDRSLRAGKNGKLGKSQALAKRVAKLLERSARQAAALGLSACAKGA